MTPEEFKERLEALPRHSRGSAWWRGVITSFREQATREDPAEFLRWSSVESAIHTGWNKWVEQAYGSTPDLLRHVLKDPPFGSPITHEEVSGTFALQGYYLQHYQDIALESDLIVEVGGGYGALPVILDRIGYKGRYIIVDFPEMLLLQEYYLANVGLLNFKVEFREQYKGDADLLVAICSMSEMTMRVRNKVNKRISWKNAFFVYQRAFNGVDNVLWFRKFGGHRFAARGYGHEVRIVRES